jgi:hypothetical protein
MWQVEAIVPTNMHIEFEMPSHGGAAGWGQEVLESS